MTCGKGERPEWNVRKWENVIGKEVKRMGLNEWKRRIERKLWTGIKKKRNQSMRDGMMEAWVEISSSVLKFIVWISL